MPNDPIEAGRKGGQIGGRSKSAAKLAACRKNGFQKRYTGDGTLLPFNPSPAEETQQQAGQSQESTPST